ncbi:MAG: ribonuclease HII [Oscillospiraceae bacterium]|jgi:ribonuclease HII|nr:ribonuclease HII [Oscillospiraceae bacterium]
MPKITPRAVAFEPCEAALCARGFLLPCGVDEAGRGPLAGDVYAAAVILPPGWVPEGLNDSKKLSPARRAALFDVIRSQAVAFCIALATVEEIEQINILQAALLAMRRAVEGLAPAADAALIDGNQRPQLAIPCQTLVKGDARCASIAAASVLAKVARDRAMVALDAQYPGYGFARHKGYGTAAHYEALARLGASPVHRPSFLPKKEGGIR